jgi:myo-inositol-1(or 4)-monophosphatase
LPEHDRQSADRDGAKQVAASGHATTKINKEHDRQSIDGDGVKQVAASGHATTKINKEHDRQSTDGDGAKQVAASGHAMTKINKEHDDDLQLLESVVREAGKIALKFYGGDYKRWSKAGGSPVTEADLAIDNFLKTELKQARPGYGWLSEESRDDRSRLEARRTFVVDPIDGTVAFMKHRPHFTICAAVVEDARPIAGLVFNPAADECFAARSGGGAFLNGMPIHVSGAREIAGCRLLGNKQVFAAWPPMHIENFSSIAYRVASVAAARFDAMISLTAKRDWDLAAADIILAEAGGRLVGADGRGLAYNRAQAVQGATIAAGPGLIAALLTELVAKNSLKTRIDSP